MKENENNEIDFSDLSSIEKDVLLKWAQKVRSTQKNDSLSFKQKIKELKALNNGAAFKSCSRLVLVHSKRYWKNASWAERMGITVGGGTLVFFGGAGSGIAALGGAIGVPLFLLTAAGGTLVGTIIDKLDKK